MTDPIADMLTRIRNAVQARHRRVDIPASKLKLEIARILESGATRQLQDGDDPALAESPQKLLRIRPASTAARRARKSRGSSASAGPATSVYSAAPACRWCSADWARPSCPPRVA